MANHMRNARPRVRRYQPLCALLDDGLMVLAPGDALQPKSCAELSRLCGSLLLPEGRHSCEYEAERREPEEEPVGESTCDQGAAGCRLSLECHQGRLSAGHVVRAASEPPRSTRGSSGIGSNWSSRRAILWPGEVAIAPSRCA